MKDEAEHLKRRIDALAELAALCDPRKRSSLEEVLAALNAVIEARHGAVDDKVTQSLREAQGLLVQHFASESLDGTAALKSVSSAVMLLQGGTAAAEEVSGAVVDRDADTVDLISGFLEEGGDNLSRADAILMAGEKAGIDSGNIAELIRVFHSIKGVAGFIDLPQICAVAHITETLLDLAREGKLALKGVTLDLVFESTSLLRKLMHEVRSALEGGTVVEKLAEVPAHVDRIKLEIDRVSSPTPAPVQVATVAIAAPAAPAAIAAPAAPAAIAAPAAPPPFEIFPMPTGPIAPKPAAPEPAPRAAPVEGEAAHGGERIRETLKVDVQRVDSVVEMIGELIIVESMVVNAPELAAVESLKLRNYLNQLTKISRDLQDVAMRMRMVPVRGVFHKMARLTRDLAHKTGKKIAMELSGEDTEMDRSMAERLEEPLVHMVRNAVDHGVELGDARRAQGKSEQATLRLSATHEGGNIVIELTDDGKGLDTAALLQKARSKGLVEANESLTDSEIHALIFAPGFSTAAS